MMLYFPIKSCTGYVHDKEALFRRVHENLKSGGRFALQQEMALLCGRQLQMIVYE